MESKAVIQANREKMEKSIEAFKVVLSKVRTGRAHPGLLDHVLVDYYGSPTPIGQIANVTVLDNRALSVSPWERNMLTAIEKAIRESDLGLNPANMGELIRVPLPALTEERRKELIKVIKSEVEQAKVTIRNLRRDGNESFKKLLKDKLISEDEDRRAQDEMQKITDKFIADIDKIFTEKEKEILTV